MNMQRALTYKDLAIQLAQHLPRKRQNHVSFITTPQGILLASGVNETKTHPQLIKLNYPYELIHSEMAAYMSIRWKAPRRMVLLNFRINNQGVLRFAKPCFHCMKWVTDVFEEIWFSTNEEIMEKL